MIHAYKIGLQKYHNKPMPKGDMCKRSKLKESEVIELRNLYETGFYTYRELHEMYGTTKRNIISIVKRDTWRHI